MYCVLCTVNKIRSGVHYTIMEALNNGVGGITDGLFTVIKIFVE